jgi:type I phosphodiesterase/nucleotide pyrophosphatase
MWETAGRAGLITANLMWSVSSRHFPLRCPTNIVRPGPPQTPSGASPTYFVPWAVCTFIFGFQGFPNDSVQDKVSLDVKLSQILEWIDLPLSERPQLILGMSSDSWALTIFLSFILAYEPSLDQAGHATGPNSRRVNV